jgi:capsule polysaccharide export protein KpsE/RkpR
MEVRLQTLRRSLADSAPEVQQALSTLVALRGQLGKLEESTDTGIGPDYIGKFREFKYQETLFELFARQYELARVDESREGTLVQVVDMAQIAERKSKPKRMLITFASSLIALVLLSAWLLVLDAWRRASRHPDTSAKLKDLRAALGRS